MIGDVLTSSILFAALRKEFPNAQLHYMIYEHTLSVVENNPDIDRFIVLDKSQSWLQHIVDIRKEDYYAVIDVYANVQTLLVTGLSKAKFRISYDKIYSRPLCTHVFSRNIKPKTIAGGAIEKRLRLLTPLSNNIPVQIKPKIYLTTLEIENAREKLRQSEIKDLSNILMIGALGSSWTKTYPLAYLAKLLDQIVEKTGATLLFNYIPSQRKEVDELFKYCAPKTQGHILLEIYGKSLREFLAITYHCHALIGNEGGAVNMAKALDVPTFAIFSPSIAKVNWSMYEDGKKNVSVHLKDFKPQLFEGLSKKQLSTAQPKLYKEFTPGLIAGQLNEFLELNAK